MSRFVDVPALAFALLFVCVLFDKAAMPQRLPPLLVDAVPAGLSDGRDADICLPAPKRPPAGHYQRPHLLTPDPRSVA